MNQNLNQSRQLIRRAIELHNELHDLYEKIEAYTCGGMPMPYSKVRGNPNFDGSGDVRTIIEGASLGGPDRHSPQEEWDRTVEEVLHEIEDVYDGEKMFTLPHKVIEEVLGSSFFPDESAEVFTYHKPKRTKK